MKLEHIDDFFNPANRPLEIAEAIVAPWATAETRGIHERYIQEILLVTAYQDEPLRAMLYDFAKDDKSHMKNPARVLTRRLSILMGAIERKFGYGQIG